MDTLDIERKVNQSASDIKHIYLFMEQIDRRLDGIGAEQRQQGNRLDDIDNRLNELAEKMNQLISLLEKGLDK